MILTNKNGNEIRTVEYSTFDFDMADDMSFSMQMPASEYKSDLTKGARLFKEDTEYGGIIGGLETSAKEDTVTITGRTWRGILSKHIIRPGSGADYRVVSGSVETIVRNFLAEFGIDGLFKISDFPTASVTNFQFDRYCTFYEGITKLLKSKDMKLVLGYERGERGNPGMVTISAADVIDYSYQTEISQNSSVYFSLEAKNDRINHLICLGKGELKDRTVIDLYIGKDGNVTTTQYFTGINEIAGVYDYSSADDEDVLREYGTKKLQEETNYQTMTMDIYSLDFQPLIGDIVGGRDYITGLTMKQPITNIIYKEENGIESTEYVVDGEIAASYEL